MYTSGSTGVPKGVNLTHTNLIATLKAFTDAIVIDYKKDVFMGYLPLAHVFELLGGNYNNFFFFFLLNLKNCFKAYSIILYFFYEVTHNFFLMSQNLLVYCAESE